MSNHDPKLLEDPLFRDLAVNYSGIKKALIGKGYDSESDLTNMKDTPYRAAKAILEIILPKKEVQDEVRKQLSIVFPSKGQSMVVTGMFPVISFCPHHFLPIFAKVAIGYVPKDSVLGLSKIIRVGQVLGKQPILQEDYTFQVAEAFYQYLKPLGVGVYVRAVHGCMLCRGVQEGATTITTEVLGDFRNSPAMKAEFLNYTHQLGREF